jgi:hypothetical protein
LLYIYDKVLHQTCRAPGYGASEYRVFVVLTRRIFAMAKTTKRESLVVASKVKGYVKSKKMMTSSDALCIISDKVYCMLDAAMERAKANRRTTVKPQDL